MPQSSKHKSRILLRSLGSIHTNEKPFTCKICGQKIGRNDNLLQHISNIHRTSAFALEDLEDETEDAETEDNTDNTEALGEILFNTAAAVRSSDGSEGERFHSDHES